MGAEWVPDSHACRCNGFLGDIGLSRDPALPTMRGSRLTSMERGSPLMRATTCPVSSVSSGQAVGTRPIFRWSTPSDPHILQKFEVINGEISGSYHTGNNALH